MQSLRTIRTSLALGNGRANISNLTSQTSLPLQPRFFSLGQAFRFDSDTTEPTEVPSANQSSSASVPVEQSREQDAVPTDSSIETSANASSPVESPNTALSAEKDVSQSAELRLPRSVQAVYLRPLRREAEYGVPSCDLQMRSYSVRNLEFFADFALRAAYYLNLPAFGPVPLPRITERWTVPRSNFIFKKSQENFERKTLRRLIQIKDGHPETVELWLAFLKKHAYYGVGMKANVWDYNELGVGKSMDVNLQNRKDMSEPKWAHFGSKKTFKTAEKVMEVLSRDNKSVLSKGQEKLKAI